MSDAPDPLEEELLSLRPHEPSPGLRRGVAERLAHAPSATPRRLWWLAVSGGLAAACLAAVLLWWWGGRGGTGRELEQADNTPRPAPPVVVEDAAPTLLAYQRALARSPEDLDALLDKHAVAPESNHEPEPIHAFTRSDEALRTLLGDD
jgi:hypothetical protein